MEKMLLITDALTYIEANLTEDLKTEEVARKLYCSKSTLEKLFRVVLHISIKEYSIRRRMSLAAREIRDNPEVSFLELAVKYGYGSNEAFTRAFKSIWHVNPSEYRKNPANFELYPAMRLDQELMEDESMKNKKKVDISELYDCFQERRNNYIIGVDIKSLIPINEIALEAGDLAILTALKRLEDACGEDDIVFRIGGDEFVALTASEDEAYAEKIIREVLSHNNETFDYKGQEIPLNLYATYYKIDASNLRYAELFAKMQRQLDAVK